jgi:hypothetical protein
MCCGGGGVPSPHECGGGGAMPLLTGFGHDGGVWVYRQQYSFEDSVPPEAQDVFSLLLAPEESLLVAAVNNQALAALYTGDVKKVGRGGLRHGRGGSDPTTVGMGWLGRPDSSKGFSS